MKFLIAAASLIAAVQALTINTPSGLTACQPSLLSWSDGTAPFFLTILPGGQTSGALKSFDQTDATSITWNVDIASGTSIVLANAARSTLSIKDSTGNIAYTDAVTIAKGSNEDCVNGDATASGQTGSAAATSGGSSATSGGSSASTTKSSGSSGSSGSSASSTASSSEESGSNAASARAFAAPAGLAGVLGLVGAALF
ncbi:hypothetical protein FB107DRAFT_267046 [Schizophyllum commune]